MIGIGTRNLVRRRAENRCEYCLLAEAHSDQPHQIEHIVAKQHGGSDDAENLALACQRCNQCKGPNLSGIDPRTGLMVALFNPRRDRWLEHFVYHGPQVVGLTAMGRATIMVLGMNDSRRMEWRAELLARGKLS